mgnify:FL=1
MNLLTRIFKFMQSEAHSLVSKFEDPVKLIEQGIRDLKKDFDESMKSVAQLKAIAIGAKKELETKKQIAADYEQKAMLLLQKAKNGELEEAEADRLAAEALKKRQEALKEVEKLTNDVKNYDASLEQMSKKILELKNKIKDSENEYNSLKARATVARTTKKVNQQLSSVGSDSTMSMIEDMKTKINAEENLAQAYGEVAGVETSIDDEINKAIGTDIDIQKSLTEMKQKLIANPNSQNVDSIEDLKKDLDS